MTPPFVYNDVDVYKSTKKRAMDIREQKAQQIAAGGMIQRAHGFWWVPSQSGESRHKVIIAGPFPQCSCDDFELRGQPCKHMIAVRLHLQAVTDGRTVPVPTEPQPTLGRKTYAQDWPNYNAAQVNEKDHFQDLLADLCGGVQEPSPKPGRGRRPIPLADAVFSAVFKVYSTVSARRFSCDLADAHERRQDQPHAALQQRAKRPGKPGGDADPVRHDPPERPAAERGRDGLRRRFVRVQHKPICEMV
jgi:hypothetical protein